ncbi:hypothetical protein [Aureimonas sp. AU12]|uniref:ribonuclease T2 family protein n=1 Tax=Aureimonas sp. AU12 TaxID=1638161 RepID=UPI0007833DFA|nr:hypothetical protein [Aureimonas sp. AU12]
MAAMLAALMPGAAAAQVPMSGSFTAEASCFATPSIRSEDNSGRIVTEPGRSYDLLGRNAVPGSHYLIRVPGAEPDRRWVPYGCGRVGDGSSSASVQPQLPAEAPARTTDRVASSAGAEDEAASGDFILAASWHPAFCEIRPRSRDCRSGGVASGGFSLHGLWPQPRGREYCGVAARIRETDERGDWMRLPAIELTVATRRALDLAMPGVASGLDRHEWWSHGTCHGGGEERYFRDSIRLLDALNRSDVRRVFEAAVGEDLQADAVRAAFDRAFGRGAGARVLIDCASGDDGRRLLQEIRISLRGPLREDADLGPLILAGATQPRGCRSGIVDAPGFG